MAVTRNVCTAARMPPPSMGLQGGMPMHPRTCPRPAPALWREAAAILNQRPTGTGWQPRRRSSIWLGKAATCTGSHHVLVRAYSPALKHVAPHPTQSQSSHDPAVMWCA